MVLKFISTDLVDINHLFIFIKYDQDLVRMEEDYKKALVGTLFPTANLSYS